MCFLSVIHCHYVGSTFVGDMSHMYRVQKRPLYHILSLMNVHGHLHEHASDDSGSRNFLSFLTDSFWNFVFIRSRCSESCVMNSSSFLCMCPRIGKFVWENNTLCIYFFHSFCLTSLRIFHYSPTEY